MISAKPDNTGLMHIALPAVVSITHAALQDEMPMWQAIESSFATIKIMEAKHASTQTRFALPEGKRAETKTITDAAGAAGFLKLYAASASASRAQAYAGRGARQVRCRTEMRSGLFLIHSSPGRTSPCFAPQAMRQA